MVTAGLLISLDTSASFSHLVALLSGNGAIFPGDCVGLWLPLAVEAEGDRELRELHDWIAGLPGVAFVDVVHVSFDDALTISPTLSN